MRRERIVASVDALLKTLALLHDDAAAVCINDAATRIEASARQVLATISEGDTLRTNLAALRRLLKVSPVDTITRRRRIADETISRGRLHLPMRRLRALLIALTAGVLLNACNAGNPPPAENDGDYVSQIQTARAAQDAAFRESTESTGAA